MNRKTIIVTLIVAVAAFLLGWSFSPSPAVAPTSPQVSEQVSKTVSVMFDFGDGDVKSYDAVQFNDGEHLFDVTKRLAEQNGLTFQFQPPGQYGIMIDQIGDKKGGTDGKYWLWYENNRMGQVASDAYRLKPGDVLEWKFVNLKTENP